MKGLPKLWKTAVLILFLGVCPRLYSSVVCESCGSDVSSDQAAVLTAYDGSFQKNVCYYCIDYAPNCFACKLPAVKNVHLADDKRLFCDRDFKVAIFDYDEMDRLAFRTANDLNRTFWRFTSSPSSS